MICSQCKRDIKTRINKFGDEIYNRHKMARAWDKSGHVSEDTKLDLQPGYNPSAKYTYEIDCPMSNQPVE
jgi:hypothetical protein